MEDFTNKIVFITGGSSGIGLAVAKQFAERGANIIIFARDEKRLKEAVAGIEGKRITDDQRVSYLRMDVSDNDEVKSVLKKAVEEFGPPDLLVNSAGRAYPKNFEDISYEQFDETMKINLYGIWNTISALYIPMKEKGGHIVNVSSIAGFIGVFGYSDYNASKFGVIGLSESIKSEFKRLGIKVSVLCPPDTDTPGLKTENITKPEETKAISANAKVLSSDEVARGLIKGLEKGRFMIIPGFDGKLTFLIKRLFPSIVEFIMEREIKKVEKRKNRTTGKAR